MKRTKPILYDPLIISRVKQYLEENVHQTYLDVGVMSKTLQERYPEYSRRKIAPFRTLVEQAYKVVSHSYGLDTSPPSGDSGSDLEVMDDTPVVATNSMNNMMTSLYSKNSSASKTDASPGDTSNELIDISSDESSDGDKTSNGKSKDGPGATVKFGEVTMRKIAITEEGLAVGEPGKQPTKKRKRSQSPQKSDEMDKKGNAPSGRKKNNTNQNTGDTGGFGDAIRRSKYRNSVVPTKPRHNFQEIGGMESVLKELCEILMHVKQPEMYFTLGLVPPRGLLLHGPPGCGKTLLANAIAGQLGLVMIEVHGTELIGGVSGESEERIRDVFHQALAHSPSVLLIDDIEPISMNRALAQRDMERRMTSQLIKCLDNLKTDDHGQAVLVIGTTSRPEILDPALRRVGRFDHEIAIGIPNRKDRREILNIICEGVLVDKNTDFDKIAELTPGYVGADLLALVSRAATIAVKKKCTLQLKEIQIKSQLNIPIVNLVDEGPAEESGSPDEKQTSLSSSVEEGKESVKSASEDVSMSVDAVVKEAEPPKDSEEDSIPSTTTPCAKELDQQEAEKSPAEAEMRAKNLIQPAKIKIPEKPTSAVINDEPIDVDELSQVEVPALKSLPEPTLFEMINMLDNTSAETTEVREFYITMDDFLEAVKSVQPSAKREGFITVPDVTWDDIGSLQDIREELKLAVLAPVKFPEKLAKLGLTAPSGVLLCGPPGCGKTLLAKAIANEAGINFISVKGPEMMNMYVGESERAVRSCFQRARNSAPCVIFFDEFDSLCPKRSDNHDSGSGTRIVNQLLTEMDGIQDRKGVYILAATNRPDIIDPAILRPGRLDTILYVGLPQRQDREEILKALTKNRKRPLLDDSVDFSQLANKTEGYTGADLAGLVRQASMLALRESLNNADLKLDNLCVNAAHFDQALSLLRPSVNAQDRKVYEKLKEKYAAPRLPVMSMGD